MDLNLTRGRRERKIAQDVAREFLRNFTSTETVAPAELLAHHFGLVCQRFSFVPDEAAATRILQHASRHVAGRRRKADRLLASLGE